MSLVIVALVNDRRMARVNHTVLIIMVGSMAGVCDVVPDVLHRVDLGQAPRVILLNGAAILVSIIRVLFVRH